MSCILLCLHISLDEQAGLWQLELKEDGSWTKTVLAGAAGLSQELLAAGQLAPEEVRRVLLDTRKPSPKLKAYGSDILSKLIPAGVKGAWLDRRKAWRKQLDEWELLPPLERATVPKPCCRTILAIDSPRLRALPWELMFDSESGLVLCQVPGAPIVRSTSVELEARLVETWPMRLMMIISADPKDDTIGATAESEAIHNALWESGHLFDLDVVDTLRIRNFNVAALENRIQRFRPHILHFIGHSQEASVGAPDALLLFIKNDMGAVQVLPWTSPQIAAVLQNLPMLHLVYLNACRTQVNAKVNAVSAHSLADLFLARSRATIAHQADVAGEAATLCAGEFYGRIAAGDPPDIAFTTARNKLFARYGHEQREAYLPVFTCSTVPDRVLRAPLKTGNQLAALPQKFQKLREHFVNQRTSLRMVLESFFGTEQEQLRRGVVVAGARQVGKTWLAGWCLHALAYQGFAIQFVRGNAAANWLDTLLGFVNPGDSILAPGLPAELRGRFFWELTHLARGESPPEKLPADLTTIGFDRSALAGAVPVNGFPQKACAAALRCWQEATNKKPVFLILDQGGGAAIPRQVELNAFEFPEAGSTGMALSDFDLLKQHFFDPIVAVPCNLRPILVLNSQDWLARADKLGVQFPLDRWKQVVIPEFDREEMPQLIHQLLRRQFPGKDTTDTEKKLLGVTAMSAGELYDLCALLGKYSPG